MTTVRAPCGLGDLEELLKMVGLAIHGHPVDFRYASWILAEIEAEGLDNFLRRVVPVEKEDD